MADKSEDVEFLQQQVQRLNSVLSQYQRKYQPPGSQDEQAVPLSSHGPHATWLTDKTLLSPLLTEYDNVITQLQQNIATYQTELLSLNARVEQVTAENARLYQQLRESLESRKMDEERSKTGKPGGTGRDTTTHTALQDQLTAITKERDGYREKWRQTAFELEHLQKSDREKNRSLERFKADLAIAQHNTLSFQQKVEELQTACVNLNEQYNQCVETAQAGEQEVEELTQALSHTRTECKALQIKNTELLKAHSQLTEQLRGRETEKVVDELGGRIDGRVHLLELSNTELEARLVAALNDITMLSKEKAELEGSVAMQRSRLAGLEREVHEAVAHVKESMEMVETAILDKDQAVIVSQQQSQEAERLRAAMDTLLQEAGHRTRTEVDAVRAEYNRNIDKMAEEIQTLEQECGGKQAMIERVEREKKAVEKEFERVRERVSVETTKAQQTIQQLQNRVHDAERVRDEACRKTNTATAAQQAAEACLAEEKCHCEEVCSEQQRRVREREEEGRRVVEERTRLAGELQEMMDRLTAETQAREAAEKRAKQELAVLSQHHELREREFQYRLQAREQTHNRSTEELRELLTSQYRMGTRWREESKNMTQRFDETLDSVRNEVASYQRKNEALKVKMDTLAKDKGKLSQQLQRLQSSQSQLQQQLRDSDTRAEAAATQVSSLLLKEQQLLAERRDLQRQLDKLKLEIAHRAGIAMAIPGLSVPSAHGASLLPTSTTHPQIPSSAPLDACGWEQAVSGLHQTIRQARQQLEGTPVQVDHTQTFANTLRQQLSGDMSRNDGPSPDSSLVSEHSALHRADLSSNSTTLPA